MTEKNLSKLARDLTSDSYRMRYLLKRGQNALVRSRVAVRQLSPADRLAPSFFVIGAQKAGTTTFFGHLCQHPEITSPLAKEIHFFEDPQNFSRGMNWYRSHFPRGPGGITGEATPSFYHPLVPRRVAAAYPDARLVLLARNPADRAFSHYQRQVRRGREELSFEDALASEQARIDDDLRMLETDETWPASALRTYAYRYQGFYLRHVRSWLEVFPRSRLLVLPSEAYFRSPAETVAKTFEFLGLPPVSIDLPEVRNRWRHETSIAADTRRRLLQEYDQANNELYEFFGTDFGWA